MANDRLFLKNLHTGGRICIAKTLGGGWYAPSNFSKESFNEFLDPEGSSTGQEQIFYLEYENDNRS